jgi:hypothetical protein
MIETCTTSFATKTHATELKTGAKNEIASSGNSAMKGTMITMVPSMTNLTDNALLKGAQ